MRSSTQERADKDPARHSMRVGAGYFEHDTVPVPPLPGGGPPCLPPAGTADGSHHWLTSPRGGKLVRLIWDSAHGVWKNLVPFAANRVGWTAGYLGGHGWSYSRPVGTAAQEAAATKKLVVARR